MYIVYHLMLPFFDHKIIINHNIPLSLLIKICFLGGNLKDLFRYLLYKTYSTKQSKITHQISSMRVISRIILGIVITVKDAARASKNLDGISPDLLHL